ncbi:MAG: TetR/AcrR family transcriptional regulator [Actinomycetota bacterium]
MRTPVSDADTPAPGRTRRNRGSEVIRDALVNAAIVEFAANGFEGASTRRIAEAAGAHQSQITYHFDTKDELWKRSLERMVGELEAAIAAATERHGEDPRALLEATIRGLVELAAHRPELSRIMMHEATSESERLAWLTATHTGRLRAVLDRQWDRFQREAGAAPIASDLLYHTVIGAASLLYANAPEARLMGVDPAEPAVVKRHADALVALFLGPAPEER